MSERVEYRWDPSPRLYRLTHAVFGPILKSYFHIQWRGAENVPTSGAVVLACNHLSNLDPVLLAIPCPRQISYLAKIELFRIPLVGSIVRRFGAIPLQRSASDPEAIRLAESVLEHNHLLALFPEGTRSRDGQLKPFRFGAARLALKYNAALVPAAITGTDHAMPSGARVPHRTRVHIAFGQPLDLAEYRYTGTAKTPEAETLEAVTSMLQTSVHNLKEQLEGQLSKTN